MLPEQVVVVPLVEPILPSVVDISHVTRQTPHVNVGEIPHGVRHVPHVVVGLNDHRDVRVHALLRLKSIDY